MHEIKVNEKSNLKLGEIELTVGDIWNREDGTTVAHIHFPKHSLLWEELGEVFTAQTGDEFRFGRNIYEIEKIIKSRKNENGKVENGQIVLKKVKTD